MSDVYEDISDRAFMDLERREVDVAVRVRTRFNYSADLMSMATGLRCDDESLAKQQYAEECDINTIVRRFNLTGQLPENVAMPTYADYNGVFDFQSAMQTMLDAEKSFMQLPADIRARFENDPQQLLEFCAHEGNREEAVKWGLVPPPPAPPAPLPPAPPAPAPAGA